MPSVDEYLADKAPEGVELFRRFERLVAQCGPSEVSVSRTIVHFRRNRVFAGAFVRGRVLETVIDLLRPIDHPCTIGSFASTKTVVTSRLRFRDPQSLDESVAALLQDAYDTVGPGATKINPGR